MDQVYADEEFRWGVMAYHRGLYNEAILSFEKSLSYKPQNTRTQEWLGRAYYESGFVSTALDIWENIIKRGEGTGVLQSFVETVKYRRGLGRELYEQERFVVAYEFSGKREEYNLFLRPVSVRSRGDGTYYLVSFGTNEVLLFGVSGGLLRRIRGGLESLDHPFDILETKDGHLFITEFEGDSIAKLTTGGSFIKRFGESGRGDGELLGPQFLASDNKGYIYVTDWGNRRVCKFDYEGNFILSFGQKKGDYEGLQGPSGIAIIEEKVYVADKLRGYIAVFDQSGNYITTLAEDDLAMPEGISVYNQKNLLVVDSGKIISYDAERETSRVLSDLSGEGRKILSVTSNANGDILAVDFNRNKLIMLSEITQLYTGFTVRVKSVISDRFPVVTAIISVRNRLGDPILGLDGSNFLITEGKRPVRDLRFQSAVNKSEKIAVSLLVDRSPGMMEKREIVEDAVNAVADSLLKMGDIRVISAGEKPAIVTEPGANKVEIGRAAVSGGRYSERWRFDLGLRLAISELVPIKNRKRAVVFLTTGDSRELSFRGYDLIELEQYMENNEIRFYCIYLEMKEGSSRELEYLCRETGGKSYFLYEQGGVKGLGEDILSSPSGLYYLTYNSLRETAFGERFIPMEVEAFLFKRSGRDEAGYFAPLE